MQASVLSNMTGKTIGLRKWHVKNMHRSVNRSVMVQFEYAKALANFSPGLFQPWDQANTINTNAESVGKGWVTVGQRFQRWLCRL
jgi:hypothetical protein